MDKPSPEVARLDDERETGAAVEKIERRKPYEAYIEADLGLRNHWYAAFFGPELPDGEVRGEMICGERIAFKRVDGRVYGLADRCPHRGAAFTSRPECFSDNTLTCWLHGFTFDVRDGSLVQILTEPGSPLIGKLKHQTYPVEEINGVVFVFIGDLDPPPPVEQDLQPKFLMEKLVVQPIARNKHLGNWRLAAENGYDAAHLYAHRNAGMFDVVPVPVPLSTYASTKDQVTMVDDEVGPWGIVKYDDINVWHASVDGNPVTAANVEPDKDYENWDIEVGLFMPCGLQVDYFPAPGVMQFEWYTPVDEDHHMYIICCAQPCENDSEAGAFRERCRTELGPLVWRKDEGQGGTVGDGHEWGFNNFDAWGREQMHHVYQYEDYWHREKLFKPDYIVVQWRMLVSKRMRGMQQRGDWAATAGWSPDGNGYDPKKGPEDF
ncbi:MAG: Rieske 2Fe-2S domain-containing protein [Gammaproteobacteria bacterium]|nr:Rieske 2Fe-2S domain-containing protein [Gammaproteobacteria bacterium]NNL99305.1 Rieske 2Fe-2S domain-containing protein [Gammaproteobacteria bacterium]